MSEPTTVRGRDMVARYALSQPDPADLSRFTYDIARIEAEAARDALTAAAGRIEALRDKALLAVDTLATQQGPTSSLALLWRAKADSYIAALAALSAEGGRDES